MRHQVLLIVTTLLVCSCAPTERSIDTEKVINHSYQNVIFEPTSNNIELESGLRLTVTPINASEFNSTIFWASTFSGNYEQESIQENYITPEQREALSSSELNYLESLEEISMEILDTIESGEISEEIGRHLISRMWEGESIGKDGSEVESFKKPRFLPTNNPFHIENQYLSVFKLEFENQGSSLYEFNRKTIQLHNGVESLKPFSTNYLSETHTNRLKIENAHRFNLPENLTVLPDQQTTKFIATPAINTSIESIHFNIIDAENSNYETIEFDVSTILEEIEIRMKRFTIDAEFDHETPQRPGRTSPSSTDYYFAVEIADNRSFPLRSNSFYATEDELQENVTICIAAFDDTVGLESKTDCKELDLSDYPDRLIEVEI